MENSIKILHITDLHLLEDKESHFLGINPYESLLAVSDHIEKEQQKPDFVIISGDFSQDYSIKSYELAKEIIKKFSCPVFAIPGNHDNPSLLKKILYNSGDVCSDKQLIADNWRILLLNTQFVGKVHGFLSAEELNFLEKEFATNQSISTLIFLHHHVLPTECLWLNKIGLINANDFLELITHKNNIKIVACGHIHQEFDSMHNGIRFLATPSTCFQFATNSLGFQLAPLMPGYRWLELYPNGTHTTKVMRIENNNRFMPDMDNKEGY
jgi:3',5'-cyclic-AMP phosphodiesterase